MFREETVEATREFGREGEAEVSWSRVNLFVTRLLLRVLDESVEGLNFLVFLETGLGCLTMATAATGSEVVRCLKVSGRGYRSEMRRQCCKTPKTSVLTKNTATTETLGRYAVREAK